MLSVFVPQYKYTLLNNKNTTVSITESIMLSLMTSVIFIIIVLLNVIMMNVIMLSAVVPRLNDTQQNNYKNMTLVMRLSIMLSVVMPTVIFFIVL